MWETLRRNTLDLKKLARGKSWAGYFAALIAKWEPGQAPTHSDTGFGFSSLLLLTSILAMARRNCQRPLAAAAARNGTGNLLSLKCAAHIFLEDIVLICFKIINAR